MIVALRFTAIVAYTLLSLHDICGGSAPMSGAEVNQYIAGGSDKIRVHKKLPCNKPNETKTGSSLPDLEDATDLIHRLDSREWRVQCSIF